MLGRNDTTIIPVLARVLPPLIAVLVVCLAAGSAAAQTAPPSDKAVALDELHSFVSTPLGVPLQRLPGPASSGLFNSSSNSLLQQLRQEGTFQPLIDRFIAAGGNFKIVAGSKDQRFPALYNVETKVITARPSLMNGDELSTQMNRDEIASFAHEFWHAYKAQVVDKGYDPDTQAAFANLKQWLVQQQVRLYDDPNAPPQKLLEAIGDDTAAVDDFADEYAAYMIYFTVFDGPYASGTRTADELYDSFFGARATQHYPAYVNGTGKVNYTVLSPPPQDFLLQVMRLTVPADAIPALPQLAPPLTRDPLQGLVQPTLDLPDLPANPRRFCSPAERHDYDQNQLKPLFDRIDATRLAVDKYEGDLTLALRDAEDKLDHATEAAQTAGDDGPKVIDTELLGEFVALQKAYDAYQTVVDDVHARYKAAAQVYTAILPVEDCQPPAPVEIMFPNVALPACSDVQREADRANVTSVLETARSEHDKWLAWRNELLFRGNMTSDASLASQIHPLLLDAQQNVDRLAKTVADLQELLDRLNVPTTACLDPCLVGSWIAGGSSPLSGLVVRFEADGKETVDYSAAAPQEVGGGDKIRWSGVGTAIIATAGGHAKIENPLPGTVIYSIISKAVPVPVNIPLKTLLGAGGLGSSSGDNTYICTPDSLSYQGSTRADRKPNLALTLRRQS